MYSTWDIYSTFLKVQANHYNRGYRLPKDWDKHWNEKLSKSKKESLQTITDFFNTKWADISPELYFEAGFSTFKRFEYKYFIDRRVIKTYIRKDKEKKRNIEVTKKSLVDSTKYVLSKISSAEFSDPLRYYCSIQYNKMMRQPIKDYIDNNISGGFIIFLMSEKILMPTDEEMGLMPYITENYREVLSILREMRLFTIELRKKIMKKYNKKLLTTQSPSGSMIYGNGNTDKDINIINKEYIKNNLNENLQ